MPRLVSKWADEPALVKQTETQQNHAKPLSIIGGKADPAKQPRNDTLSPTKASLFASRKPLVSKWADAPPPGESDEKKKPSKGPKGEELKPKHTKGRRESFSKRGDESGANKGSKDRKKVRNEGPRHQPRERSDGQPRKSVDESHNHENGEGDRPPMTKAARSFAQRLGTPAPAKLDAPKERKRDFKANNKSKKTTGEAKANSEDEYETTEGEDSDEPKPPMSEAAMSFAARLAIPPASTAKSSGPKQKYLSPKQRKEAEKQQQQQQKIQEQKLRDAKIKEEVRDMFTKMTSRTTNWADLEDE